MPEEVDSYQSLVQFLYSTPIGLVQSTLAGTVEMINPMAAQLLMPLSSDGGLDNLFELLDTVAPQLRQQAAAFEGTSGVVCESVRLPGLRGRDGLAPRTLSVSVLKLGADRLMVVLNDVTEEVRREQLRMARRLDDATRVDALTKMPNRAAVLNRIELAIAARDGERRDETLSSFAVLFINCDRFKQINESLGRAVGDELLGLMAGRLCSTLRLNDRATLDFEQAPVAARIGGDEFVVLLQDLQCPDDVHAVARRIMDTLAPPYGIGTAQVGCTVSMGVVLGAQVAGTGNDVLQDANIAMDQAKQAGGLRYVVFEPEMREKAQRRSGLEADLRRGLDAEEFFVVYQPVVGLQHACGIDRAAGVEALVRWRHPTRGLVPPIEFIGAAEECGLIVPLGHFVLRAACGQFVAWQRELGKRAPRLLAVNLSRAQLAQEGFIGSVRDVLAETHMNPTQLQLEVTESLAAQDEFVQQRLHELKRLGLTLALDDFGTGYSSLASLHLLPVDTVKIDRSFVSQAHSSAHHQVLIEATVRVAKSLGMATVAEGIETEAQADVVIRMGCAKGQGYLFGKPMPAHEIVSWLAIGEPLSV